MSSLYNYLIFVLLLKETCFKRLQESYIYNLKLDRHQGFFCLFQQKNCIKSNTLVYYCLSLLSPVCTRSKNFLEHHLCHRWKWKLPSKNWHQGKHSSRRSNLTVNFQDIKKIFLKKVTEKIWSLTYAVWSRVIFKKSLYDFYPSLSSVLGNLIKSFMRRD